MSESQNKTIVKNTTTAKLKKIKIFIDMQLL